MKHTPLYDIDDLVCPTVGDTFRGKTGRIIEICIGSYGILYGLLDLPLSYGKTLYYNYAYT
jgi:hypothetical protein